jgi:hypothetical protein
MTGLSRPNDPTGGVIGGGEHALEVLTDVKDAAAFLRSKLPL